mgnify:CR=1 FL=1
MEHFDFTYSILIVALPAIMFLILGLGGKYMKPVVAGILGTTSLSVMTILSYLTAYQYFFVVGKVDIIYVFTGYCGYIALVLTFYSMLYLSICKDYKKISGFKF